MKKISTKPLETIKTLLKSLEEQANATILINNMPGKENTKKNQEKKIKEQILIIKKYIATYSRIFISNKPDMEKHFNKCFRSISSIMLNDKIKINNEILSQINKKIEETKQNIETLKTIINKS